MMWLDQQVALITGGASGLGRAVVERFLDEGAKVVVFDIDQEGLDELNTEYNEVCTVQGDVTSLSDNKKAVSTAVEEFGRIDIFVGNAGVFDDNVSLPEIEEDGLRESFVELFEVNVLGYLLGARAALPELIKTEGRMVFTASQASFNPDGGGILYVPSKHAIAGIVRQLAFELAPKVRVNAVAPGYVPTELSATATLGGERSIVTSEEFDSSNHPLDFVPAPKDYTGAYVLLASEEDSRPMTGTIIRADLGRSVRGITSVAGRAIDFVTDGL